MEDVFCGIVDIFIGDELFDVFDVLGVVGLFECFGLICVDIGIGVGFGEYYGGLLVVLYVFGCLFVLFIIVFDVKGLGQYWFQVEKVC